MKKFEYCISSVRNIDLINLHGKEGWELVSVVCETGLASRLTGYFKREIIQQPVSDIGCPLGLGY